MNTRFHRKRCIRRGDEEHHLLGLIPEENALTAPKSDDEISLEDLIRAIPLLGTEVYCEED